MSLLRTTACTLVLVCACADDPTQIVVVLNTDLETGTDIQSVELEVDGSVLSEMVPPSPRTALLRHSGGELGPIRVMVRGLRDGLRRIEREAVVSFVEGKTLLLNLCLSRDCLEDTSCAGSRTCTENGCRSPRIDDLPEYNGTIPTSCGAIVGEDAGGLDAAIDADDAGMVDTATDVGPVCWLAGGICNVGDVVMPGDRLDPMPCDGRPPTVIEWRWGPASAPTNVLLPFIADTPGMYVVEATQPDVSGCEASFDVRVADVEVADDTGAPGAPIIDLAAAPDVAFATTGAQEAWAIRRMLGWSNMRSGGTGNEPSGNLESVGVLGRRPVFGTVEDEAGVYSVMSSPDFTSNDWDEHNLPGSDDRGFALSARADGSMPLAVAYGEGIGVLFDLSGGMDMLRGYDAGYDADIAVSFADPDAYGAIWVLSRTRQEVLNVDVGGGDEYNDGNPESTDIGEPNAIEVTENAGRANLWLCGLDALWMYDLRDAIDIDVPTREAPVTPCHDVAVDGMGGIWVAADSGLQRFDADGDLVANLPVVGGYRHVAYAEGPTGREIWAVTPANEVHWLAER